MSEHPEVGSCDLPEEGTSVARSPHRRFQPDTFGWDGVTPRVYKTGGEPGTGAAWRNVVRHTLGGNSGEPMGFELRYFEIAPGGYTSLEKHAHVHSIVILRGSGQVVVGRDVFTVRPFDLVYVPSGVPHQFVNDGMAPFGFLCPVDANRDPPQPLTQAELHTLLEDPRVREVIKVATSVERAPSLR